MEKVSNKMKKISLFIIVGILILPIFYINIDNVVADSNTYYVANNGSDSNNGLSPSTPWKTIGKVNTKMSDGTIKQGDNIYFKRGDTFTDAELNIKVGGTSTDRMIIGDYGTGNNPIFDRNTGNEIITCSTANVNYITIQNLTLKNGGDALQVWNNHTDIIISGITIIGCSHNAMYFNATIGLSIKNCVITNPGYGGIELYGSHYHRLSNVIIKNVTITNTLYPVADGIEIHYMDEPPNYDVGSNFLIENCTATGFGRAGFDAVSGENIVFKNCSAYGNTQAGITLGWGIKNVTIINFYFHDQLASNACGITTDDASQVIIRNSRFFNIRYHDIVTSNSVPTNNITIFNNDIVFDGQSTGIMLDIGEGSRDVIYKNNIILSLNNSAPTKMVRYLGAATTTNTRSNWSNNIYYRGDNGSSLWQELESGLTWTQWRAKSETWNEKKQNPMIDPINNIWNLNSSSPCIDTGTWLTTTNGGGTGITITVHNARYFYDGYDITRGDVITIGSNPPVEVTEVNYRTNIITVNKSISWTDGDSISMPYSGTGSDIGAYEFLLNEDDNTLPEITQINSITSNPLDIDPLFGWVNISCVVIDDVAVNTVKLLMKKPDHSWNNVTMTFRSTNTYYYQSNNAFSQAGNYSYQIKASDTNGNVKFSDSYTFLMPPNWDINNDGECSILDLVLVSNQYNEIGPLGWIREDVDNNGEINVLDFTLLVNHYGENWLV